MTLYAHALALFLSLAVFVTEDMAVRAWIQCSEEDGGGMCPDLATCCPTGIPGVSSCISGTKHDPDGGRGECCDPEGTNGCPYGYVCARKGGSNSFHAGVDTHGNTNPNYHYHHRQQQQQQQEENRSRAICKRREPHPRDLNAKETPQYKLCRLPSSPEVLQLQAFPIDDKFNATYYSSMGSILPPSAIAANNENDNDPSIYMQKFSSIETVLVIQHGSGRNADDYLCAGISVVASAAAGGNTTRDNEKILVIAPKFVADVDHDDRDRNPNTLYWLEQGADVPLGHTWRYGADAANAWSPGDSGLRRQGISSYDVMDRLLEYLIGSKLHGEDQKVSMMRGSTHQEQRESFNFPNLKRIVVAGHSAGGQYVHRWTLLSSSNIIWGNDSDYTRSSRDHSVTANGRG
ncbi:unnamed protein product [Pseudo-nitzschia multistriata]|uniref:Uncharacterized protein n=1 Tax=Pseudo-nitzschia multistriata TaxID=183589 RepID=A0A448ZHI2_9STRA|nr:unnamed protein product [Pseudo-nitzschia multistriata]